MIGLVFAPAAAFAWNSLPFLFDDPFSSSEVDLQEAKGRQP